MNGMHQSHGYAYTTDSDYYTISRHYELAPTSCLVQLSLSTYFEFDDEATAQLGISRVEYLDSSNVTRHKDYNDIPELPTAVAINRMTRVDFELTVSNAWADYLLNVFFWDSVS